MPLEGPLAKLVQDTDFSIFGPLATEDIIDDLRGSAYFVSARNYIACNAQCCGNARANQPYIAQRDVCLAGAAGFRTSAFRISRNCLVSSPRTWSFQPLDREV